MISQLHFTCYKCGDPQACRVIISLDLQGGVPVFSPSRCVVSPAFDKVVEWSFEKQTPEPK